MKRCEHDMSFKKTRINKITFQVEKTENDDLPPIQVDINGLQSQIECLETETGTELSDTLNKIEKSLLNELEETQTKLGTEFEVQTQALEEISVKHQRLQRLLDDNLLKRKQELEKEIARYIRKIQELGSLPPSSELDAFVKASIVALMKKLECCNKKLKKYSHIIKKAYDEYVNFS